MGKSPRLKLKTRVNGLRLAVAMFLLICPGESQQPHRLVGPDHKPLPGQPGGARLSFDQLTTPDLSYLQFLEAADRTEAQQLRYPERLSGTSENPHVAWTKTSDTFYSFEFADGTTLGVTRFPPGVRSIELLKIPTRQQAHQLNGSSAIFAANLPSCTEAFWVQYVGRNDEFVTKSSLVPIKKRLSPEIDGGAPYGIQKQMGPGSAFMTDFAGGAGPVGTSAEAFAIEGIPWYAREGRISAEGITQFTARYHFWSYAICAKPRYVVAGRFEWGYTTRLDTLKEPHVKTDREPIRWIEEDLR